MTGTFCRTEPYQVKRSEYGGRICASDFNRKTTLAEMAARIAADRKFDEHCRKNILNRQNYTG